MSGVRAPIHPTLVREPAALLTPTPPHPPPCIPPHASGATLNWRDYTNLSLQTRTNTPVTFYWTTCPRCTKTGMVQLAPPGLCQPGGSAPVSPISWTGIKVKGTKNLATSGKLTLTFQRPGTYYLTSPGHNQCNSE